MHRYTTEEVLVYDHNEKKKMQEEKRREVAMAEGTQQSVATRYNVSIHSVREWRKKYRGV